MNRSADAAAGSFETIDGPSGKIHFSRRTSVFIRESLAYRDNNAIAKLAILFGSIENNETVVSEVRPLKAANGAGPALPLSSEEELNLRRVLDSDVRDWRGNKLIAVGYCSRERSGWALSSADLEFQERHFSKPNQVVVVAGRDSDNRLAAAVYGSDREGRLDPAAKPYEMVSVSGPSFQVPEPYSAAAIPEEGAVTSRYPKLKWVAFAAGLGVAAIATWRFHFQETRSAQPISLSARVADSNILFEWNDANRNGGGKLLSAELSLVDGQNLTRIPLSEDKLHKGMLLYAPRSSDVLAHLSVARQGIPVQEQGMRFEIPESLAAGRNSFDTQSNAVSTTELEDMRREMLFWMAHSRRLETTLKILNSRKQPAK